MNNFNSKTVCKIIDITKRQIDHWDRTHLIKPSVQEASGYGSVRLYSFQDLIQFKVVKTLTDKGVSIQKIRKSLNYLRKHLPAVNKPLAELRFLTDGETIFVLTGNNKQIIDTLKSGQLVFSIAIGELVEELKDKIEVVVKEKGYSVSVCGKKFDVVLHPDTEDGGFWIECPSLSGCASQGETVEDALSMITDAIEGHLEIAKEDNLKQTRKTKAA
ncbi:MAG: MerR family transcriptional regulator [Candidatus Schekmanbacteria bacterium]|nr:MerR family transcriptional regulator [Candidatus Schekmanbacteria bacterium]